MMCFTSSELNRIFDGEMTALEVSECVSNMAKEAKISTPEERARARRYRQKNKAELARKSKIRRQKIKSGLKRKRKRIGTAAGGYQFVHDGDSSGGGGGGRGGHMSSARGPSNTKYNFSPGQNPRSSHRPSRVPKVT